MLGIKSGIRTPPPAFPNETEKMKDNDAGVSNSSI